MISNRQRRVRVAVKPLEEFLQRVQQTLRLAEYEVTVRLVSDAAIARMNQGFRGKRGPTDVLSFPADGKPRMAQGQETIKTQRTPGIQRTQRAPRTRSSQENDGATELSSFTSSTSYLGDIAISPETARRNARRSSRALPQELRILILHGMLHLAGYDHETDDGEMDRLERHLRRRLGLS